MGRLEQTEKGEVVSVTGVRGEKSLQSAFCFLGDFRWRRVLSLGEERVFFSSCVGFQRFEIMRAHLLLFRRVVFVFVIVLVRGDGHKVIILSITDRDLPDWTLSSQSSCFPS